MKLTQAIKRMNAAISQSPLINSGLIDLPL
jgi:hypothetical protein